MNCLFRFVFFSALTLTILTSTAMAAQTSPQKTPGKADAAKLLQHEDVAADRPIFDSDTFPTIDYINKDLIQAAFGPYALKVRFFDAAYNEVTKPSGPGRYGARVEISFPGGYTDLQRLTLFKTPKPYRTYRDIFTVTARLPDSFGIPGDVQANEDWNVKDFFNHMIHDDGGRSDLRAVMVNALADIQADPARWHGFSFWVPDDAWWNGLEKKLGATQDYQRIVTLPPHYDAKPGQRWPLIIFLHGSGERGTDLDVLKDKGPLGFISSKQGHPLPFIVVTPQCPRREWWSPEKVALLLDKIEAQYRVDPKRVYLTGLSMGGFGAFDTAAIYPQRFAAIAPLSGGEDPDIAGRLKTMPTWIFHGAEDNVVPARYSIDIADKMKAIGATEVKLTLYPNVGHEKWDVTYANPALYDWFLQHSLP